MSPGAPPPAAPGTAPPRRPRSRRQRHLSLRICRVAAGSDGPSRALPPTPLSCAFSHLYRLTRYDAFLRYAACVAYDLALPL
ncbi:hypothetical protein [Streptomyces chattanoogensis]|uniref:hypothetical protein n=1 Tax=Streptomyces chattanoogensis TaxID=66876 RepID=UPI0012FF30F6